MTKHTNKKTRT